MGEPRFPAFSSVGAVGSLAGVVVEEEAGRLLVLQVVYILSGDGARGGSMVVHLRHRARDPRWPPGAISPVLDSGAADPDLKSDATVVATRESGDRQRRMEALRSSRIGDFPSAWGHLRVQGCEGAAAARRRHVLFLSVASLCRGTVVLFSSSRRSFL